MFFHYLVTLTKIILLKGLRRSFFIPDFFQTDCLVKQVRLTIAKPVIQR